MIGRVRVFLRSGGKRLLLFVGGFFLTAAGVLVGLYDDPRLSASMRLALREPELVGAAAAFNWQQVEQSFEVGELPVIAGTAEVDRILLARVDPARFRFVVRNRPGDKDPAAWLDDLGAAKQRS
jgi:hypothetical protein